jgi:hypothetical protein
MKHAEQAKSLLQTAYSDVMYAERFCKEYLLKAQKLGLQGEKRRLRYYSVIYHKLGNYLKTDFYDLFGEDIVCACEKHDFELVSGISDFFQKLLEYSIRMYDKFHASANALMSVHGYNYSCAMLERVKYIGDDIKEYRRIISEGVDAGWSDAYIQRLMLRQTTDENVHDRFEEMEGK